MSELPAWPKLLLSCLDDLDSQAEGEGQGEEDEEDRNEDESVGTNSLALLTGWGTGVRAGAVREGLV